MYRLFVGGRSEVEHKETALINYSFNVLSNIIVCSKRTRRSAHFLPNSPFRSAQFVQLDLCGACDEVVQRAVRLPRRLLLRRN